MSTVTSDVGVVIITRDRRNSLLNTLGHLARLPERPPIVVVDNGSSDGTVETVRREFPEVRVIPLGGNMGSAGRNVGVRDVGTPYVAFADDDSWWMPGALQRAAELFAAYPRLAVIGGRILVGPEQGIDPVCMEMAASPVRAPRALPGPAVLGFVACGAVVRADAFLTAGGFHSRFGVGGEEELLSLDLAAQGWDLAYVDDVVACHYPSPSRDPERRRRLQARNALWCCWLRRSPRTAAWHTVRAARRAFRDPAARGGLIDAVKGMPWVVRERSRLPHDVERNVRLLEQESPPELRRAPAPEPSAIDVFGEPK